jgi:hypothetical protein
MLQVCSLSLTRL